MKPDYLVPSMNEVRQIPWNGFNVASTFSGGGGSSTGYRMSGFRVLYANEFVDSAKDTYRANMADYTSLDGSDIRSVNGSDVLSSCGLSVGELDNLDGSPPCAAFSTAGKREKGWGESKKYSDKAQVSDDLFFEFSRLVSEVRPKTFIAENVSGMVKGKAKGYFKIILADLRSKGYRVTAKVLDAKWLGVPQTRQRIIFIGVRDDLGLMPVHPSPMPYSYSVSEAIPWLSDSGGGPFKVETESSMRKYAVGAEWDGLPLGGKSLKYLSLIRQNPQKPSNTITASAGMPSAASVSHPYECRKFSVAETKRLSGFPDDYILKGSYSQQIERLGRSVPPVMMSHIAAAVRDGILKKIGNP